jgi:hypothetical protein
MLYGYLNSPFVSNPFSDAAIPPSSVVFPVISGSGVIGQTLSTTNGTWSGTLPITYTYQWNRNGSIILGATFNTYTLVTADGSTSITCTVTATNAGGSLSKSSNAISVAAAEDADANAFIAAAAITDATQKSAINTLVIDLKGYGIWTKMKAIYPMVGGTASAHKWNLKTPIDSNSAYRLVFNGGWTHSSTGAKPNGTNGYANTFFNPITNGMTTANAHLAYYARTINTISDGAEIGSYSSPMFGGYIIQGISGGSLSGLNRYFYELVKGASKAVATSPIGLILGSSISNSRRDIYNNGVSVGNNTLTDTNLLPNFNLYIGAGNIDNTGAGSYSNAQFALASIGDGLTDTQAANYYTAVQAFQTTLSRNV